MANDNPLSPGDDSGAGEPKTETFHITLTSGSGPCEYCEDLTKVRNGPFSAEDDLHWRLGVLFLLREWLQYHGAFTVGSGVLAHIVADAERPEDIAEAGPITGTVIAACEVTTTVRQIAPAPALH